MPLEIGTSFFGFRPFLAMDIDHLDRCFLEQFLDLVAVADGLLDLGRQCRGHVEGAAASAFNH